MDVLILSILGLITLIVVVGVGTSYLLQRRDNDTRPR